MYKILELFKNQKHHDNIIYVIIETSAVEIERSISFHKTLSGAETRIKAIKGFGKFAHSKLFIKSDWLEA